MTVRLRPWMVASAVLFAGGLATACDAEDGEEAVFDRFALTTAPAFEGRLVTRIADYADGTSRTGLVLRGEERSIAVVLGEGVELEPGALVRAWGELDTRGRLLVERADVLEPAPTKERSIDAEPRPPRRVAFVLLTWEGEGPSPLTVEEAKSRVFTGNTSTNNYYQEVSYGREKITGQVFGPYAIPKPSGCGDIDDPLGTDKISLEARRKVKEEYPNAENDFQQFMYYFPQWSACQWAGLAEVGTPDYPMRDTWYNQSSGCVVLAQELGHNYGMRHSHSYECTGGPYSDDCQFSEYGHPFDPMGGGCGHMNQIQKAYMDWTYACNQVTATADGTFNLNASELPCNGPQALRFATGNVDGQGNPLYYHLEYRRPLGLFDGPGGQWGQGLSGVVVHVSQDPKANKIENMGEELVYGPDSYILEMPGNSWLMHEGDAYADHEGVVSFSVLDEGDAHAVIQVQFPGGGSGEPSCLDDSVPATEEGNYGSLECSAGPIAPDLTAPTVAIAYPADGDVLPPGSTFDILVDAQDERGVADVLLYVNGQPQYKVFAEPWEWPVQNIPEGTYELGAVASDGPNWTASQPIYFTVGEGAGETGETGGDGDETGTDEGGTGSGGSEDAGAEPSAEGGGCGCRTLGGGTTGALGWLVVAAGSLRRRRPREGA